MDEEILMVVILISILIVAGALASEITAPYSVRGEPNTKSATATVVRDSSTMLLGSKTIPAMDYVFMMGNGGMMEMHRRMMSPNVITNMTPGTKAPHGIVVSIVSNAANMGNKAFQPNLINIKIGNTVVWINDDIVIHTVTSGSGPNDLNYGKQFNSGFLVEGQSITHTFKTAGRFNYLCQVHPLMVGQVIVE